MNEPEKIKCWTCAKFKVTKKGLLDCGFSVMAKHDREEGYYHTGCPEYERDV